MGSKAAKKQRTEQDEHEQAGREQPAGAPRKLKTKVYDKEIFELQIELCKLQDWVK